MDNTALTSSTDTKLNTRRLAARPKRTNNQEPPKTTYDDISHELTRIPGLFRPWELKFILKPGFDYLLEKDGATDTGTQLFAVYKREVKGLVITDG